MQREEQNEFSRPEEVRSYLPGGALRKTISTKVGPHKVYQLLETHRGLQQPEMNFVQSSQQNTGVPTKKEVEQMSSRNSRIQTRS